MYWTYFPYKYYFKIKYYDFLVKVYWPKWQVLWFATSLADGIRWFLSSPLGEAYDTLVAPTKMPFNAITIS